jgi:hypothetical protein
MIMLSQFPLAPQLRLPSVLDDQQRVDFLFFLHFITWLWLPAGGT